MIAPAGATVQVDGAPTTATGSALGDGAHTVWVIGLDATTTSTGYAIIETDQPSSVLVAVVPSWGTSFAMTRAARL